MTLEQLRLQFRSGKISATEALKLVTPHLMGRAKKNAEAFVNEILAMPEELEDNSELDAQIARGWYKDET